MMEQLSVNFVNLLVLAIGLAVGWLVTKWQAAEKLAKEGVDKTVPQDWHWALENAVDVAVRAAEQLFDADQNGDKLEWAMDYAFKYMRAQGFPLSKEGEDLIRGAIEKAVFDLKKEIESLPDDI